MYFFSNRLSFLSFLPSSPSFEGMTYTPLLLLRVFLFPFPLLPFFQCCDTTVFFDGTHSPYNPFVSCFDTHTHTHTHITGMEWNWSESLTHLIERKKKEINWRILISMVMCVNPSSRPPHLVSCTVSSLLYLYLYLPDPVRFSDSLSPVALPVCRWVQRCFWCHPF